MTDELERQVERGGLFTHTALSECAERLTEVETMLYGLLDVLAADGAVDPARVAAAAASVRSQLDLRGETVSPGVALRVDPQDGPSFTPVNCAERMHICHAICCRLHFALTAAEVEGGIAKWDLGQPYRIRQSASGTCVHNETETGRCGIYDDRPVVCKRYSCANDTRIWSDFERMELNQEWIEENLNGSEPQLVRTSMVWVNTPHLRPDLEESPSD